MSATQGKTIKVVVSGPVGAGKTTFIRTLSDIPVVNTDERASEAIGKSHTTVALDFGQITLGDYCVHLFGTPGQSRFDFMWELLSEGAFGLLLLLPSDHPQSFAHARTILEHITSRHALPFVVATTRGDLTSKAWQPEEVADYFDLPTAQVIAINAEQRDSAQSALIRLVEVLETPGPDERPIPRKNHE